MLEKNLKALSSSLSNSLKTAQGMRDVMKFQLPMHEEEF
jgi:hypothetical protein